MAPRIENSISEETPLVTFQDDNLLTTTTVWGRIKSELLEQLDTAIPTVQSMVLTKIPWLISLRFVGGIGAEELAAAALATTLCNVTGLSLSVGLSSALSTLAGQAKGELQSRFINNDKNQRRDHTTSIVMEDGLPATVINQQHQKQQQQQQKQQNDDDIEPLMPLVFLYRGMVIQLALVIPVGIWWMFGIKDFLIYLGQQESLSVMTERYLRILAPGLWFYSINWTLTAWVQAIGMAYVPAYAAMIGLALHIPFNLFFIYVVDFGYLGCAVATVCFQLAQPIFMITYLFVFAKGREQLLESMGGHAIGRKGLSFWNEFMVAVSCPRGYLQYLGLALPGIVIISEWWASETSIFLSGRLMPFPELALGAMTIYQSINSTCFMFPVAFSVAGSARVSNLLGAGHATKAAFAAKMSVFSAACVSLMLGTILYLVPHTYFPSFFAPGEEDLIIETSKTIPLLATYVFADGIQTSLNGVIKGCGRQCIIVPIVLVAYWLIAVPLAYYLAFILHDGEMECDGYFCGVVGLVGGMTAGTWVHMILLAVVVRYTTNWDIEAKKAKERVVNKK